jgi:hypothetical protein
MFAAVSGGRIGRLRVICGAVALFGARAAAAAAAEADVTVKCDAVSVEEAAQVEARIRANLLSAGLEPTAVELECDGEAAQTRVTGGGHSVLLRANRNAPSVKDALLANADAALSAWVTLGSPVAVFPAPAPVAPVRPAAAACAPSAPVAPVPTATRAPVCSDAKLLTPARARGVWLSAGVRAEHWHLGSALGAELGLARPLGEGWLVAQAGYLVAIPAPARFSVRELQLGGELAWQPSQTLGLRGALGVGLSVLGVTPESGVSARNATTSSLPFLGLSLTRAVELGSVALVPVLGFRAFPHARAIDVDSTKKLELPAFAPQAALNFAVKLGG